MSITVTIKVGDREIPISNPNFVPFDPPTSPQNQIAGVHPNVPNQSSPRPPLGELTLTIPEALEEGTEFESAVLGSNRKFIVTECKAGGAGSFGIKASTKS